MSWRPRKESEERHWLRRPVFASTPVAEREIQQGGLDPIAADTPKPNGVLVVTLHEARGLSLPQQCRDALTDNGTHAGKCRVYALLDHDKTQIMVKSVGGGVENPLWTGSKTQYKFDVSRLGQATSELTVYLYIGNLAAAMPGSGQRSQDICLGVVHLRPQTDDIQTASSTTPTTADDDSQTTEATWADLHPPRTGQLRIGATYHAASTTAAAADQLRIHDFALLKVVGRLGPFASRVLQVRKKDTDRLYALKGIRKADIVLPEDGVSYSALAARSVLARIHSPFIVPPKFAFESPKKLYLGMPYVQGGELLPHHHHRQSQSQPQSAAAAREKAISSNLPFDLPLARLYTAELLTALDALHAHGIAYAALHPSNIRLDLQGHIAICDFGLGLCGLDMHTSEGDGEELSAEYEYVAPELLLAAEGGSGLMCEQAAAADWWTLGVVLFEMLTGVAPFCGGDEDGTRDKVLSAPLEFPDEGGSGAVVVGAEARDLLVKLLEKDPARRLGAKGADEIKGHKFFADMDWQKVVRREYEPAFRADVTESDPQLVLDWEPASVSQFEDPPILTQEIMNQFAGFEYNKG